jgi:hypothetical protein
VQVTRDGGLHWTNVTMRGLGAYGRVETVEPSPFHASAAFAVVDRHFLGDRRPFVFATDDYGASWHSIAAGLPQDQYAHVIRQDPRAPNLLYAGLEQGVCVSLDGGRHWASLQQNMPPASVPDLRIQPVAGDLIAATHGRSFFILDDLEPLRELSNARAAGEYFFRTRPAYLFWHSWSNGYGTAAGECCAPSDRFAGENPDPGASFSYYLDRPLARAPTVQVRDGAGIVLRTLAGSNHAGINRLSWDLTEAPPVPWRSAREWNQGPSDGASVVPGQYMIRLNLGDRSIEQPLVVKPDPRATWTLEDLVARRDFVRGLLRELNDIDAALNDLDRRAKRHSLSSDERAVYAEITSNPRNSEDDLFRPDRLRERLQTLLLDMALSQSPPTPAQRQESARIAATFATVMRRYHALATTGRAPHVRTEPGAVGFSRP